MSYVDFTTPAVEYAKKAGELCEQKEYQKSHQAYLKSLEFFMAAIKHEKDKRKQDMLRAKAIDIADTAERVKAIVDGDTGGGGGGGSAQAQKGKTKEENEEEKMKGALASAIVVAKPNVHWDDVAGLERAKDALQEAVVLPMRFPQLFTGKRKPWKGILMYGPPGTGKSYIASAVATECDSTFFSVSSADIMSKWVGESEKLVRSLFQMARDQKPSVIFIDEVDSLCSARGSGDNDSSSRVKTEFLVQMQGVGKDDRGVLVLAATNLPHQLDSAIRRRFEYRIEIPLPDAPARATMFKIHLGKTPNTLTEGDFAVLAGRAEGYSGSDISVLVRNALMEPVRTLQQATFFERVEFTDPETGELVTRLLPHCTRPGPPHPRGPRRLEVMQMSLMDIPADQQKLVQPAPVSAQDFENAFASARPSVSQKDLKEIQQFTEEYGVSASDKGTTREVEVPGVACQTMIFDVRRDLPRDPMRGGYAGGY